MKIYHSNPFSPTSLINEDESTDESAPLIASKRENAWETVKEKAEEISGSEHLIEEIEQAYINDYCKQNELSRSKLDPAEKEALLRTNVASLFKRLTEEFSGPSEFTSLGKLIENCENKDFVTLCNWANLKQQGADETVGVVKEKTEDLAVLREHLTPLSKINYLRLNDYGIKTIPSEFRKFSELTTLNLSRNKIKYIPKIISNLISLENLYLNDNQICYVPDSLGSCKELKQLNLSTNKIDRISDRIGDLTQLSVLNLSQNHLTQLPSCFKSLKKLEKLDFDRNYLTVFFDKAIFNTNQSIQYLISQAIEINDYQCKGKISYFLKKILRDIDYPEFFKRSFDQLDPKYRNLIIQEFAKGNFPNGYDKTVFEREFYHYIERFPGRFHSAIKRVIINTYSNLSEDQQMLVKKKFRDPSVVQLPEDVKNLPEDEKHKHLDYYPQYKPEYNILRLSDILEELNLYPESTEKYFEKSVTSNPPEIPKSKKKDPESSCILS